MISLQTSKLKQSWDNGFYLLIEAHNLLSVALFTSIIKINASGPSLSVKPIFINIDSRIES